MKNRLALCVAGVALLWGTSALGHAASGTAVQQEARSGVRDQSPDSAEALQRFLQNALTVALKGDSEKLTALIKEMEIPNYREWFVETYGPAGSDFAEAYAAKLDQQDLARLHMLQATARWMKQSRTKTVLIRRVNDAPSPSQPFEANAVRNLQRPVDIFLAYYRVPGAAGLSPIGYFVFVNGKFRWQSGFVEDVVTHRIIVDVAH